MELRNLPQLRERQRGKFSRGSRAFLHFHEDAGELYVDVRLDSAFQRVKVTSPSEQADLICTGAAGASVGILTQVSMPTVQLCGQRPQKAV